MSCKVNKVLSDPLKLESAKRRFAKKVASGSPDECWEWQSKSVSTTGYGRMSAGRDAYFKSHRLAWAIANGPIPDGANVLHRCDNRLCCNPNHLFLGTMKENTHDMMRKGRMKPPPMHFGERHPHTKFDEKTARQIAADTRTARVIAAEYGVCTQTVYRLKRGETWLGLSTNRGST